MSSFNSSILLLLLFLCWSLCVLSRAWSSFYSSFNSSILLLLFFFVGLLCSVLQFIHIIIIISCWSGLGPRCNSISFSRNMSSSIHPYYYYYLLVFSAGNMSSFSIHPYYYYYFFVGLLCSGNVFFQFIHIIIIISFCWSLVFYPRLQGLGSTTRALVVFFSIHCNYMLLLCSVPGNLYVFFQFIHIIIYYFFCWSLVEHVFFLFIHIIIIISLLVSLCSVLQVWVHACNSMLVSPAGLGPNSMLLGLGPRCNSMFLGKYVFQFIHIIIIISLFVSLVSVLRAWSTEHVFFQFIHVIIIIYFFVGLLCSYPAGLGPYCNSMFLLGNVFFQFIHIIIIISFCWSLYVLSCRAWSTL
ncbi:unnamed protein product [Acanthosepion pharaonis]|uniref:Uncharacterized protein n=1 Tax=Acanthosepion pharaonis TaxID=158019 RepID=A0A812BAE4_ACAPH|nr:unnamed protein product [Sepia pharaonis]